MNIEYLWNDDEPIKPRIAQWDLDEIPAWIDQNITPYDIAGICEGGCASGAYMPAVVYDQALDTMGRHGDAVLDYLEDALGELPAPTARESWSGMASHFLSAAVELWAQAAADAIGPTQEEEV